MTTAHEITTGLALAYRRHLASTIRLTVPTDNHGPMTGSQRTTLRLAFCAAGDDARSFADDGDVHVANVLALAARQAIASAIAEGYSLAAAAARDAWENGTRGPDDATGVEMIGPHRDETYANPVPLFD